MKVYTLDEIQDMYIGKNGTKKREAFESRLKLKLINKTVKKSSK